MTPKIGIILINYKIYAKRFLEDCRDSMRKIEYPKDKCVVYIVDNATSPETEQYLREVYPEAVVIPNKENSGWGGGNNVGIEQAFKDGCEDVVLANMDVIVHSVWLKELVAVAYCEPSPTSPLPWGEGGRRPGEGKPVGIVQSKLLLWPIKDGVQRINSLGNQIHFLGFGYCRGYGELDVDMARSDLRSGRRSDLPISDIPYASGASMYVKSEVFKKVRLCNPDFFMYHDDMELCLKARFAGYRIVLAPKSIMWHKYEFKRSIMQIYYMERNRLIIMLEFYKLPTLILLAPAFFAMELCVFFGAILGGYAKSKLRSWGYFFKFDSWRAILRERRNIQFMRTMPDRILMQDFIGKILFREVMNPILRYAINPLMNLYWQVAKRVMWW